MRRFGFPFRMPFSEFAERYRVVAPAALFGYGGGGGGRHGALLAALCDDKKALERDEYALGKTKVSRIE